MRRGIIVFNRVNEHGLQGRTAAELRAALEPLAGARLAARAADNLADFDVLARRDRETIERVLKQLGGDNARRVPHFNEDVRDLSTLARVGAQLLDTPERARR